MKINEKLVWDYELTDETIKSESFKEIYIRRVIVQGTRQDVLDIDLETVKAYLHKIPLPEHIKDFWKWFFTQEKTCLLEKPSEANPN